MSTNEIKELKNKIFILEKEKKELIIKDEESTQLIIKLDNKLHDARSQIATMKSSLEQSEKNTQQIKELSMCLENISNFAKSIQEDNESLKKEIAKLKAVPGNQ
jgi:chromosome segregation ATPase